MSIKKKVIALGMVFVLALGMATSAFADAKGSTYYYYRITGPKPLRMSAGLSGQAVTTNSDVVLDTDRAVWRQQWKHVATPNGTAWVVREGESQNLALNINRSNNNCNVHSWKDNTPADYAISMMNPQGIPEASQIALIRDPNFLKLDARSQVGNSLKWSANLYLYFYELSA